MEELKFDAGAGKYLVCATLFFCGKDIVLIIGGGDKPHVGACAVGVPRASLDTELGGVSSSASVICVNGHKEDELARDAALELAAEYDCTVAVSVGIHVDNASKEDIVRLTDNFTLVLAAVKQSLNKKYGG